MVLCDHFRTFTLFRTDPHTFILAHGARGDT